MDNMDKQYYVIKKVLNNNVVISENLDKKEVIVLGSGIGFGKHVHDVVDDKKILKIYELRNNAYKNRFEQLIEEIPFECFQLTESIIDYATEELHQKFKDGLILSLADHINFAVTQNKNHETRVTLASEEIKMFYKDEYNVGLHAVKMINDFYHIDLQPNEATTIAYHLIMASTNQNAEDINVIVQGTKDILAIIEKELDIKLDNSKQGYNRLLIHLKYFMKRVIIDKQESENQIETALFNENDERYIRISKCLDKIQEYLKETYDYSLDSAERLYLIIHITRVL